MQWNFVSACVGGACVELRIPGAVRATGVGPQLKAGTSAVCKTRGRHRAIAGRLGNGLAGEAPTQRATEVGASEFLAAYGLKPAGELN